MIFFLAVIINEFSWLHGFYVSKKSYLHQQQFMDLPIIVCPQLMPIFRFINDQNHPLIRGMAYNVSWIAMPSSKWSYQLCSNANKQRKCARRMNKWNLQCKLYQNQQEECVIFSLLLLKWCFLSAQGFEH